ncbi:MAG: TonB family protein [Aliifodinibius sp.]|nr:energy transducer TonB [candidate division Zixibacteria bacterium]NIT59976.1 energy transducer TonB [Fodinibius sp.]NIW42218.1 TonB family protein [candidate division Zixibacteria bacterium]NIY28559.1 TonB family protein [Fodinibius sp.]
MPGLLGGKTSTYIFALLAVLFVIRLTVSCGESIPEELGVYAYTNQGIFQVSNYGYQKSSRYFVANLPVEKIDSISSFLVNIPDAVITESRLFRIESYQDMRKIYYDDLESVKSSTNKIREGIYKINVEEFDFNKLGYIALKLSMPLGVPDRLYILKCGEEEIATTASPVYVDLSQLPPPNIQKTVKKPEIHDEQSDKTEEHQNSRGTSDISYQSAASDSLSIDSLPVNNEKTLAQENGFTEPKLDPNEDYPEPDEFIAYDQEPTLLAASEVNYPELAKKAGVTGNVWLKVLVDKNGDVRDVMVMKKSGLKAGFEEAAIEAAYERKYEPAMQNNQPVAVWVAYKVEFKLND